MPWNLLIFPLASGYYVLTRSYFFKFIQQRLDRQRLIFESILLGSFIGFFVFVLRFILEYLFPKCIPFIYSLSPYKAPYTLTSLSTLFVAILFADGINLFLDEKKYILKAIRSVGNELELILAASFSENLLLQFTLNNNKFYIAWVKELPIPAVSNYLRLVPAISGYRNSEKELVFTTHYLNIYSEYLQEGKIQNIDELNVNLILDLNSIVSVAYFDPEMHERFHKIKEITNMNKA